MIRFTFYKNKNDALIGFNCTSHGRDIVCAAVSALTMNAVNSIEMFSDAEFSVDFNEDGGFMEFILSDKEIEPAAALLLDSLDLGICSIAAEYEDEIEVFVKEV